MAYQLQSNDGSLLDAHFDVDGNTIVFHSRGGSKQKNGSNLDYRPALEMLLQRLSQGGAPVEKAWLDSAVVQSVPVKERIILDGADTGMPHKEQVGRMAARMQAMGRKPTAKSPHGNFTKRIRLQVSAPAVTAALLETIKAVRVQKDTRSLERLPVPELEKVTAEHLWRAVQKLSNGYFGHAFKGSRDFDVLLPNGLRLAPKAVFGVAATEALGFEVKPKHFTGGVDAYCFRALHDAGYLVVPKDAQTGQDAPPDPPPADREWYEGSPKLRTHLGRERATGLREAKKAEFRRRHGGLLFCEKCGMDPVKTYGSVNGEACIEVHHAKVQVADMLEKHVSKLEDLQCLCANCHRVEHRLMKSSVDLSIS